MQAAMIQKKNGEWVKGFCDYYARQSGEVFTDFAFGDTAKIVVSVERVNNSQDGRNWFHVLQDATESEIAEANSNDGEEISFGGFFDILAD